MRKVSFIIPAFNEAENLSVLAERIEVLICDLNEKYVFDVLFIDDGSTDETEKVLLDLSLKKPVFRYISFSRNFGHQVAIKAGLDLSDGDCVVMLDADLQHPPELISSMLDKWEEGFEIVYTKRKDDPNLNRFKSLTSKLFYLLISKLSNVQIDNGAADFRLVDKNVANVLKTLDELDFFWRGLIVWVGFNQTSLEYFPANRYAGESKYTFRKMVQFAIKGITSFSTKPLRLSLFLGFFVSSLSFIYALYALLMYFINDRVVSGWASLLIATLLLGGLQLIILGIIGEYLGKLFMQSKKRPHYIIRNSSFIKNPVGHEQ